MSDDSTDSGWMDERDPDVQETLTCDVELYIETGDTYREIHAKAAWALRTLALQIEAGKLDDGCHPITTLNGEKLGEVYIDRSGIAGR